MDINQIEQEAAELYPDNNVSGNPLIYGKRIGYKAGRLKSIEEKDREISELKEKLKTRTDEKDFILKEFDKDEQEIKELKAWKEWSMSVTPDMQKIGKLLNVKLGDSIHDKIIPGIENKDRRIKELEDALAKIVETCSWSTDGRKFDGNHKEVLKLISEKAKSII